MGRRLLVLYGSQTGCAEEVAEHVSREGARRHLEVVLRGMDEYDVKMLPSEEMAIFVCSTTGQGDPPDNMKPFWNFLLRKSLPPDSLSTCSFAVFGMGDSGYAKFNATGKRLDKRLEMLGGQRLVPLGLGDDQDANGYDQALDPWMEALWARLLEMCPLPPGAVIDTSRSLPQPRYVIELVKPGSLLSCDDQGQQQVAGGAGEAWSSSNPFMAAVTASRSLSGPGAEKEVRHFELDVAGSGISFKPGDSVAVQPSNRPEDVEAFASLLGMDLEQLVVLAPAAGAPSGASAVSEPVCGWGIVSLGSILSQHCDIMGVPRRYFFHLLSFFCHGDDVQRERLEEFSSVAGRDDLYSYCQKQGRSFLEVFRDFPAARPPLHYLLDLIPRIRPREYSISSGPSPHPNRIEITAAMVRYTSSTTMERFGVCTSFLALQGSKGGKVPIWIRPGSLRIPLKLQGPPPPPLVMVGPGTGLAPLRCFIQERAHQRSLGAGSPSKDLLFFGCRTRQHDFLYQSELEGYEHRGDLKKLSVAFSRDQQAKVYVQDMIEREGAAVWEALEQGGIIMVCGSADKMPDAVRRSFVTVASRVGNMGEEGGEEFIKSLEKSGRYLIDTWA